MSDSSACVLCEGTGGRTVWADELCRVVAVAEPGYPGFCRVILSRHVVEMTDLAPADRRRLMEVVFAVESSLLRLLRPDKINLASFGNMTPHLHWHVIPRWHDDPHFPQAFWGPVQRPAGHSRQEPDAFALAGAITDYLERGQCKEV